MKPSNGNGQVQILTAELHRLARNLWWSWHPPAQELFKSLSPRAWENLYHSPVAILNEVSAYELRVRLMDPAFAAKAKSVLASFDAYLKDERTWGRQNAPELLERPAAYFSAEFGFHESLPITAGGLGILSADHVKSASDLGLGFVGLGLFYREGYFMQSLDHQNWQVESYATLNPKNLPLEPVLDDKGEPVIGAVPIAGAQVRFRAWRVNVGRIVRLPARHGPARERALPTRPDPARLRQATPRPGSCRSCCWASEECGCFAPWASGLRSSI